MDTFTTEVIACIRNIPVGKVATYGQIGALAGKPTGARQVSRILHAMSRKHRLPWHRVVNKQGRISLPPFDGYEVQKARLESEGIVFDAHDRIDLDRYLWDGRD